MVLKISPSVIRIKKPFSKELRIVSMTDLKGIIAYVNDGFVEMSSFDSLNSGFAPAERQRLCTAHEISGLTGC